MSGSWGRKAATGSGIGGGLNIAGAATTIVKTGGGTLDRITVNKAVVNGVITIYDNVAASGTKLATITHPATLLASQYSLPYGIPFSTGLTIVTSAADDITVAFR
jgi:hypothetical protein